MSKLTAKEQAILTNMEVLDLTREEAEELYAFDMGETSNEEVDKIEAEEKEETEAQRQARLERQVAHEKAKAKRTVNRDAIIEDVFGKTARSEYVFHCQQITSNKMSFVDAEGKFYTVQVTAHKSRPNGYVRDIHEG